MMSEQDEIRLSQLADGELDGDQAADVLLGVLDDAPSRERLKALLRMRRSLAPWRQRQPSRPVVLVHHEAHGVRWRRAGRWAGLAAAACVGGLLVLAGVWTARTRPSAAEQKAELQGPAGATVAASVTPEQMRQVAKVFALHESVAGPLAWYAADDQSIRVASAVGSQGQHAPVAGLLTLGPTVTGGVARTYIIVCRERQPATIELPGATAESPGIRVILDPRATNGKVDMQYAIAVDASQRQGAPAILSGQRHVGLTGTPLGQLALGDHLLNVEAAAWSLKEQTN